MGGKKGGGKKGGKKGGGYYMGKGDTYYEGDGGDYSYYSYYGKGDRALREDSFDEDLPVSPDAPASDLASPAVRRLRNRSKQEDESQRRQGFYSWFYDDESEENS
uniref:Uncharacterized protein n=1 Tax=Grammatophora oceanica TaxID=210454 RepID=A0A7S1V2F6_9STRA